MYHNGISHLTASSDYEGILKIIEWLALIGKTSGSTLPVSVPSDIVDRPIIYTPTKAPYNPRYILFLAFVFCAYISQNFLIDC